MTQVISPNDDGIRDFTQRVDVKFRIDDDVFVGVPGVPGLALLRFGTLFDGMTESQFAADPKALNEMMKLVLTDESAELFLARMDSREKPISLGQMMDVLPWLMEKYGMRPTEPSSDSQPGSPSPDGGTSSTVVASPSASTSTSSALTAS